MRAINITMRKIFAIDDLDKALSYYRAREIKFGDAEKNYKKALLPDCRAGSAFAYGGLHDHRDWDDAGAELCY